MGIAYDLKKRKKKKGAPWNPVKDIFIIFDMNLFTLNNKKKKIGKYRFAHLSSNAFVLFKTVVTISCLMHVIQIKNKNINTQFGQTR